MGHPLYWRGLDVCHQPFESLELSLDLKYGLGE